MPRGRTFILCFFPPSLLFKASASDQYHGNERQEKQREAVKKKKLQFSFHSHNLCLTPTLRPSRALFISDPGPRSSINVPVIPPEERGVELLWRCFIHLFARSKIRTREGGRGGMRVLVSKLQKKKLTETKRRNFFLSSTRCRA